MELPGLQPLPSIPMALPQLLVRLAEGRGVDRRRLLRAAHVDEADLGRDDGHLPAPHYAALIHHTMAMTDDPCFGFELGLNIPPTLFGFLGLALMCASTNREAVEMGVRYMPLGTRFVDVRLHDRHDGVALSVHERWPLGPVGQFAIESTMAAWLGCARHLAGDGHTDTARARARLAFAWRKPAAFSRYEARLPCAAFEAAGNEIFVPHDLLAQPLKLAQPQTARQARAQCEHELERVLRGSESLVTQVAETLVLDAHGCPSLEEVARRMGIAPRTLSRRLERMGVSFRQVVEARRKLEAEAMLRGTAHSIDDIATRLGYLNPANFTRAFKRWTGQTPTAFRGKGPHASSGIAQRQ